MKEKSDLCLVVGDVTSTMGGSIAARRLGVPVAHVRFQFLVKKMHAFYFLTHLPHVLGHQACNEKRLADAIFA